MDKVNEIHNEHAKTVAPDDLLGQVRRTLNGKPLDDSQVDLINDAIASALQLDPHDVLLDLCCGNGMLSDPAFARCRGGVGVDLGAYLIDVARRHFGRRPGTAYVVDDVTHFVATDADPQRFSKALCYGSFQYLSSEAARTLLSTLRDRYAIERLFLGNLPDRSRLRAFYTDDRYVPGIEDDNETLIGLWRTPEELIDLAMATGWDARISYMPDRFYAAHYRFDAVLTPRT
jgi:hypothetical protein